MMAEAQSAAARDSVLFSEQIDDPVSAWESPELVEGGNFNEEAREPPVSAQRIEEIEAEAAREGQARGYKEGYAKGIESAAAEVNQLRVLLEHLSAPLARIEEETEQALVALMLELARRLAQKEIEADPINVLGIVREAVDHLSSPLQSIRVRLHPEDARVVAVHLEDEEATSPWTIVPDVKLMRGDCLVESDGARVDARLDTRQSQLAERVLGRNEG